MLCRPAQTAQVTAGSSIRVNAVAPGFIETPFTSKVLANETVKQWLLDRTPMGRIGVPGGHAAVGDDLADFLGIAGHVVKRDELERARPALAWAVALHARAGIVRAFAVPDASIDAWKTVWSLARGAACAVGTRKICPSCACTTPTPTESKAGSTMFWKCRGLAMKASWSPWKMFTSDGGGATPRGTEKQRPCAWRGPVG